MGLTAEQYWSADPYLAVCARKAKDIENEEHNYWLWLQGVYIHEAVTVAIGNAFRGKGKQPAKFSQKPYDIFGKEKETPKQKRQRIADDAVAKLNLFKQAWDRKHNDGSTKPTT